MNIDEAAKQSKIDLDDTEHALIEDDLNDIMDILEELKAFKPDPPTTTQPAELRTDESKDQDFHPTSEHRDGDKIRSPDT